ncbi:MAG: hypothetical protein U0W40_13595 [Acidimicrobiia bacterium]
MGRVIDEVHVELTVQALLGAIDTGDGGTDEQRAVLRALVDGYWQRPELDLGALAALRRRPRPPRSPTRRVRVRVRELMVVLELAATR